MKNCAFHSNDLGAKGLSTRFYAQFNPSLLQMGGRKQSKFYPLLECAAAQHCTHSPL
jgi:hypothetical protein